MNDTDAVIEFEKGVKITEIAQLLHSIYSWVGYKVEVGCIIATKKQLIKTTMDIEDHRRAARFFGVKMTGIRRRTTRFKNTD